MDFEHDVPTFFSGPFLDRRSEVRETDTTLEQARAAASTRYVVTRGTAQLMREASPGSLGPSIAFLAGDDPVVRAARPEELVLLGWFEGTACILIDFDDGRIVEPPAGGHFEELRPLASRVSGGEAQLLATARALTIWRARHRFCGICGSATRPERAGHLLRCTNPDCAQAIFPRIDPAIIVLVTDGERALLGRQPSWPEGRYSTIAGFVEPGESLEDAVAREVLEETGVRVKQVEYLASQPWPFPSSLMLGFQARAETGSLIRVGGELADARWFTRGEIASGTPLLPPSHAISFRLIAAWYDAGASVPLAMLRP